MPFTPGDVVVIDAASGVDDPAAWRGILCRVTPRESGWPSSSPQTWLTPLTRRPDGYGMNPFFWATDRLSFVRAAVPHQRSETSQMPILTDTIAVGDRVVLKPIDDYAANSDLSSPLRDAGGMDGIFTVAMLTDQHRPNPLLHLEGVDGGHYVERFTFAPEGAEATVSAPVAEAIAAVVEAIEMLPEAPPAPVPAPVPFAVGDRVRVISEFCDDDIAIGTIGTVTRVNDPDYVDYGHTPPRPHLAVKFEADYGGYYGDGEYIAIMGDNPATGGAPIEALELVEAAPTAPVDDLLDWEVELLSPVPGLTEVPVTEPEPLATFSVGDQVIVLASAADDRSPETGAHGAAYRGDPFPVSAEVRRIVSSPGYYSLMSTDGRIQTVHATHLRPAPEPEVVSYSQAAVDELVDRARTEAATARQDEINGLTSQAQILRGQIDSQKRVVANVLMERLVDEEGWERTSAKELLTTMGIDPGVYVDEPVWEFQITRTITHTVRATRDGSGEPSLDFINQSVQCVDTDDVELDSDWLDVEIVDTEDDWQVVRGSITRDS